jgi:hypothetical protein
MTVFNGIAATERSAPPREAGCQGTTHDAIALSRSSLGVASSGGALDVGEFGLRELEPRNLLISSECQGRPRNSENRESGFEPRKRLCARYLRSMPG